MPEKNYYEILEVAEDATPEVIREAFMLQIKFFHPDRHQHDKKLMSRAEEKTKTLNNAYDTLKDPSKKQAYDFTLSQSRRTTSHTNNSSTNSQSDNVNSPSSPEPPHPVPPQTSPQPATVVDIQAEDKLVRKIFLRLVPFLFFLYIIAYLDRVNVGFAKLQMTSFPWMSESVFGFGAGVFFIGYFLFEIPSNLLLERFGARRWLARIMVTWGLVAMAMLFTRSVPTFYSLRFALGLAEAGFFPGVLLYLTYWFTARERARVIAMFMTANSIAFIFGGPLSGWLMGLPPIGGLAGWQQLFLWEGLPAVLMGGVVLWYLPNGPQNALWLTDAEKALVQTRLARERAGQVVVHRSPLQAIAQPGVLMLCATFFCSVVGMYGISMWLPQIMDTIGKQTPNGKLTSLQVGFLTAVPYTAAGICMVANAFHSDRTGERRLHVVGAATVGAIGLMGCALFPTPLPSLFFVTVAAGGMWATNGPFWALPPQVLRRSGPGAMAGGIALINAVGNLGGFVGPFLIGKIKDATGDFAPALFTLAGSLVLGAIVMVFNKHVAEPPAQPTDPSLTQK